MKRRKILSQGRLLYKASSVMCRDFLEHHVKGYTLGLGSCCDHNPTFESDVTILIFKRLLMNLLAEGIHSKALPKILGDSELLGLGIHVIEGPPDIEPHIISTGTTQDTAATITSPPPARTAASQQTPASHAEYSSSTSLK
uniref:Uncharacterized protein n=1 Tax=Magallana gigas TaxID=29159 RepID=A0A8W8MNQ8_MAGGI